jgi:hypothetical protein
MAHHNPMLARYPGAQFGNRRVRLLGNARTQHGVIRLDTRSDADDGTSAFVIEPW